MSLDINMMYGIVVIAFIALVALVGVFSDTRDRGGFKFFLVLLVLIGAGAGGAQEYFQDKDRQRDAKKLEDAVALAKTSNKLAEDAISSHQTDLRGFAGEREKLQADSSRARALAAALVGHIASMNERIEDLEKAAKKARKADLSDMGFKMRLEASQDVVKTAKEGEWMDASDLAGLEAWGKEEVPLKGKHFKQIQQALLAAPEDGGDTAGR